MKRNWPSSISISLRKVSRQAPGARNGSSPSTTSISATAVSRLSVTEYTAPAAAPRRHLPAGRPPERMYLKNSEFGSSTSTSLRFLKLAR